MKTKDHTPLSRTSCFTSSSSQKDASSMSSGNVVVVSVPVPITTTKKKHKHHSSTNVVSSNDSGFSLSPSSPKRIHASSSSKSYLTSPSSMHPIARSWHSSSSTTSTPSFATMPNSTTSHSFSSSKSIPIVKKPKKQVHFNFSKMTYRMLPKDSVTYWKKVEKQLKSYHLIHSVQLAFADYYITDHHGQPIVHVGPLGPWSPHQALSPRARLNSMPTLAFSKLSIKHKEEPFTSSKNPSLHLDSKNISTVPKDHYGHAQKKPNEKVSLKQKEKEEKVYSTDFNEPEVHLSKKEKGKNQDVEEDELLFHMDESITSSKDHLINAKQKHDVGHQESHVNIPSKTECLEAQMKEVQVSGQFLKHAFLFRQPSHSILHLPPRSHGYAATSNQDQANSFAYYFVDLTRLKKMIESDPEASSETWQTIHSNPTSSTSSSCSSSISSSLSSASTVSTFSRLKKQSSTSPTSNTSCNPHSYPCSLKSESESFYKPHTNTITLHF